jgi:LuxR family transcriptional activator of bioluminescence operon
MYGNDLNNILELLKKVDDLDALQTLCAKFCDLVDVPFYLLGVIDSSSLYAPKIQTLTNYPDRWMDLYLEENKQRVDPVVEYMMTSHCPIRWDKLVQIERFQYAEQQNLMAQARKFGLFNGFSIPIRAISGEIVVFSMGIGDVPNSSKKLDSIQPFAHSFSFHLYERFFMITSKLSEKNKDLTKRELDCLFWACEGKTAWEISQIINVSERTVLFHLNNSKFKLGASNRQHAVALAIKKGIFKPIV